MRMRYLKSIESSQAASFLVLERCQIGRGRKTWMKLIIFKRESRSLLLLLLFSTWFNQHPTSWLHFSIELLLIHRQSVFFLFRWLFCRCLGACVIFTRHILSMVAVSLNDSQKCWLFCRLKGGRYSPGIFGVDCQVQQELKLRSWRCRKSRARSLHPAESRRRRRWVFLFDKGRIEF